MHKLRSLLIVVIIIILVMSSLSGCLFFQPYGRLSATVLFVHSDPEMQSWLDKPTKSFVQAYFMFSSDLASDIIFGIDQEFIEGVNDPIHFPGADWMALIGLTRDGMLNFPVGTDESLNGTPSDTSVWEFIDLEIELKPDTWYFMKETADFQSRRFHDFMLQGPDVNITIDLSDFYVDYPNYIPIDHRSMTYYVFSVRMSPYVQPGSTSVFFDDVKAGIETNNGFEIIFSNSFESQTQCPDLPITLPVTPLADFNEYYWYKDNEDAKLTIVQEPVRSGQYSCECNATLDGLSRIKLINSIFKI